jgi:hypothetical protein
VDKLSEIQSDTRGQFYKNGQTKEIKDIGNFTDGYAVQNLETLHVPEVKGSDKAR